jgi:hypothetical protein
MRRKRAFAGFDNLSDFGLRTTLVSQTPPGQEWSNGSVGRVCCGLVRSLATSEKELPQNVCTTGVAEAGEFGAQSTDAALRNRTHTQKARQLFFIF